MSKFRVWDKDHGQYLDLKEFVFYQNELRIVLGIEVVGDIINSAMHVTADPDCYIVEWFTGFCDRNGKEVFFGDVMINKKENLWIVAFDPTECKAVLRSKGKDLMLTHTVRSIEEWAVTGTIHDGEASDG